MICGVSSDRFGVIPASVSLDCVRVLSRKCLAGAHLSAYRGGTV